MTDQQLTADERYRQNSARCCAALSCVKGALRLLRAHDLDEDDLDEAWAVLLAKALQNISDLDQALYTQWQQAAERAKAAA